MTEKQVGRLAKVRESFARAGAVSAGALLPGLVLTAQGNRVMGLILASIGLVGLGCTLIKNGQIQEIEFAAAEDRTLGHC